MPYVSVNTADKSSFTIDFLIQEVVNEQKQVVQIWKAYVEHGET